MWGSRMLINIAKKALFFAALLVLCFTRIGYAQEINSEQIKAAYLINFLKHVQWPNEENKQQYRIAIYQDPAFTQLLRSTFNNRRVKGKPVDIINISQSIDGKLIDLAFVPKEAQSDIAQLAAQLRKTETLLVSDNSVDKHNIMINLVFDERSAAISFELNKSNVVFENLRVSPELLLLGGTELDVATLYRETELAMQKMRQRESKLNQTLSEQQALLSQTSKLLSNSSKRLKTLDIELKNSGQIAKQRQLQLNTLQADIEIQKQAVLEKEAKLATLSEELQSSQDSLDKQTQQFAVKELESNKMAQRITDNQQILDLQQSKLDKQNQQLTQKNVELAQNTELIEQQQFYILLMFIVISIAVLFLVLVIWLFLKNKRITFKLQNTLENLKSMQDQLVQSEKLASLGQLTAGIAHEINTPLGIAVTSTSATLENTREIVEKFEANAISKSALKKYLDAMQSAANHNTSSLERVIELLNNFKQVAADQVIEEVRELDLVNYVNEVISTLSAEIKKYRVDYQYIGLEKLLIKTMPGSLAQVITNLVTNSLKHGFDDKKGGLISIDIIDNGNQITLIYKDNGNGMTSEVLHNIFEPFFTTKRNSGGTGLGMNIVFNIIRQKLHGQIEVTSAPGEGACFTLTLPRTIETTE